MVEGKVEVVSTVDTTSLTVLMAHMAPLGGPQVPLSPLISSLMRAVEPAHVGGVVSTPPPHQHMRAAEPAHAGGVVSTPPPHQHTRAAEPAHVGGVVSTPPPHQHMKAEQPSIGSAKPPG